jgi:hypothetical protein
MMTTLGLCLNKSTLTSKETCAVCAAVFVPAEDAGSRMLSLMVPDQATLTVLMCGGCHSKWSHGVTVTARLSSTDAAAVPVLRHHERG